MIINEDLEYEESESKNPEIKTISDHKNQVSKTAKIKKISLLIRDINR